MTGGNFTLYGVVDGENVEYKEIITNPSNITVDPYNVQNTPLTINLVNRVGATSSPINGYISVYAKFADAKIAGTEMNLGYNSKITYTMASKDMKLARATSIVIEAYADVGKGIKLASSEVQINMVGTPDLSYRNISWSSTPSWSDLPPNTLFRNGDYIVIEKNNQVHMYMWKCRVQGNSSKAPWDMTAADPEIWMWEHKTENTWFATQILMARRAKLGSAVFFDNYMISQHGIGTGTFTDFNPNNLSTFTPNLYIDWLKGELIGHRVHVKGGDIGGLNISDNSLSTPNNNFHFQIGNTSSDGDRKLIHIGGSYDTAIDVYINEKRNESQQFVERTALCLRTDEYQLSETTTALKIRCNNKDAKAIDAIGKVVFDGPFILNGQFTLNGSLIWKQKLNDTVDMPGALFGATINGSTGKPITRWGEGAKLSDSDFSRLSPGVYKITHHLWHNNFFVSATAWKHGSKNNPMIANVIQKDTQEIAIRIVDNGGVVSDTNFEIILIGKN